MVIKIIIAAVALFLIYAIVPSCMVAEKVLHPRPKTLEDVKRLQEEDGIYRPEHLLGTKKEVVPLRSDFGYDIYAFVIYNETPSRHVVILSHGVTCRSELMFRYLKIFLDMGYNVLFLDHRCHGRTGGDVVGYGHFEKYDLLKAVQWARTQFTGRIGLHGESMGASISMLAAGLTDVDFLIEDCGYSSFGEELRYNLKTMPFLCSAVHYPPSRLLIRLFGKYDIEKITPAVAMAGTNMPVLIIHGTKDAYVPFSMAETIYKSIRHERKSLYAPETGHAYSVKYDTTEYERQIRIFLQKYGCYFGKDAAEGSGAEGENRP